jgi:hypothetical protein
MKQGMVRAHRHRGTAAVGGEPDPQTGRAQLLLRPAVGVGTAGALLTDAVVHLQDAHAYDPVRTSLLSQGELFRVEAVVAILVAAAVLVRPRLVVWTLALAVLSGGLGAVLLYRYVDVGRIGPVPNMYEPTWQSPGKLLSAYAEGAGAVLAAAGCLLVMRATSRAKASAR